MFRFKNLIFLCNIFIANYCVISQNYHPPLDFKMLLSGTFGELRSNHFHTGIDIKTEGVEGQKVYAIDDGYVSRIKVSTWGYGKALYITHPDGKTSVYAHLKEFNKNINSYVVDEQYKREKFELQLFPKKDKFKITKGQIIALSGNSGGSAGAHLHFEIRDTKTERPINPLQFNFDIYDNVKPIINKIKIYPIDGEINGKREEISYSLKKVGEQYTLKDVLPIVNGTVGFSISTYDKADSAYNKNGVYSIKMIVDSNLVYSFKMDEFGFDESRYINAHIDYKEKLKNKIKYHRCFKLPNNQLSLYHKKSKEGIVNFKDDKNHIIRFEVTDYYNNKSIVSFQVKSSSNSKAGIDSIINPYFTKNMKYLRPNIYKNKNFYLHMESYSLYEDLNFNYRELDSIQGVFGKIHHVHNELTPVHKSYIISLKANIPKNIKDKVYIAKIDKDGNFIYMGGTWRNKMLSVKVREFGEFCIAADTTQPIIKGLNIFPGKKLNRQKSIKCIIYDNESGIQSFRGSIDDKWILMEYDYKNKLLIHKIKDDLDKGEHMFKLEVTDKLGNLKKYLVKFNL